MSPRLLPPTPRDHPLAIADRGTLPPSPPSPRFSTALRRTAQCINMLDDSASAPSPILTRSSRRPARPVTGEPFADLSSAESAPRMVDLFCSAVALRRMRPARSPPFQRGWTRDPQGCRRRGHPRGADGSNSTVAESCAFERWLRALFAAPAPPMTRLPVVEVPDDADRLSHPFRHSTLPCSLSSAPIAQNVAVSTAKETLAKAFRSR